MNLRKRGQSTFEITIIATFVVLGILIMGPYVTRAINAHFKLWDDSVQDSFADPLLQAEPGEVILEGCECERIVRGCGSAPEGGENCPPGSRLIDFNCPDGCPANVPFCLPDEECCADDWAAGECGGEHCTPRQRTFSRNCGSAENTEFEYRCEDDPDCEFICTDEQGFPPDDTNYDPEIYIPCADESAYELTDDTVIELVPSEEDCRDVNGELIPCAYHCAPGYRLDGFQCVPYECNDFVYAGRSGTTEFPIEVGPDAEGFSIRYQTYEEPDHFEIVVDGVVVARGGGSTCAEWGNVNLDVSAYAGWSLEELTEFIGTDLDDFNLVAAENFRGLRSQPSNRRRPESVVRAMAEELTRNQFERRAWCIDSDNDLEHGTWDTLVWDGYTPNEQGQTIIVRAIGSNRSTAWIFQVICECNSGSPIRLYGNQCNYFNVEAGSTVIHDDQAVIWDRDGSQLHNQWQPDNNTVTWNRDVDVVVFAGEQLYYRNCNPRSGAHYVTVEILDLSRNVIDTITFNHDSSTTYDIGSNGYVRFPEGVVSREYNGLEIIPGDACAAPPPDCSIHTNQRVAQCPDGTVLLGGGCSGSTSRYMNIISSGYPVANQGYSCPTSTSPGANIGYRQAVAICCHFDDPTDCIIQEAPDPHEPLETIYCPAEHFLTGGGCKVQNQSRPLVFDSGSFPSGNGWICQMAGGFRGDISEAWPHVICCDRGSPKDCYSAQADSCPVTHFLTGGGCSGVTQVPSVGSHVIGGIPENNGYRCIPELPQFGAAEQLDATAICCAAPPPAQDSATPWDYAIHDRDGYASVYIRQFGIQYESVTDCQRAINQYDTCGQTREGWYECQPLEDRDCNVARCMQGYEARCPFVDDDPFNRPDPFAPFDPFAPPAPPPSGCAVHYIETGAIRCNSVGPEADTCDYDPERSYGPEIPIGYECPETLRHGPCTDISVDFTGEERRRSVFCESDI